MKPLFIAAVVGVAGFSAPTWAQDICAAYVGQTVKPTSFDAAIVPFAKLTPKSEFESTAQFEARRAMSLGSSVSQIIISKAPENVAENVLYNADTQKLSISAFAFKSINFNAWDAFYGAKTDVEADISHNIDAAISQIDRPIGTYVGTNGFGAVARVIKVQRDTKAIFQGKADFQTDGLFPAAAKSPYIIGELAMSPAEAKVLKATLRLAFVVTPKEPFVVKGSQFLGAATVDDPREITENFTVMIADISCGLLMDAKGKVLGAYPTQGARPVVTSVPALVPQTGVPRAIASTHTIPPYPALSSRLGEQGTTVLTVTVGRDGRVIVATVKASSGSARLDQSAADYVKENWRYERPSMETNVVESIVWDLKNAS